MQNLAFSKSTDLISLNLGIVMKFCLETWYLITFVDSLLLYVCDELIHLLVKLSGFVKNTYLDYLTNFFEIERLSR